jgi:hypothetical protein
MKKIMILILVIPIFLSFKTGQEIDEMKMNRDLEIAKNILATLIKTGSNSFFGGQSIEASYIKDYGVVFTIPEHLVYFNTSADHFFEIPDAPSIPDIPAIADVDVQFDFDYDDDSDLLVEEEARARAKENIEKAKKDMERAKADMKRNQEEMKLRQEETRAAIAKSRELRELYVNSDKKSDINWEEVMVTFMTDYADLIGQLQPEEKIVINQKSPYSEMVFIWKGNGTSERQETPSSSISAEVARKDVSAYKSGKINKDEFVKRISINKLEPQKKIADLEMFAGIFDKYYGYDLSETFYSQGKPGYEVLDGYGVVFHVKASSPNHTFGRVRFFNPGDTPDVVKSEKKGEEDEAIYPKFKEDVKQFMLDYGRTIRSLKDDDKLLLEVKIQACDNCGVPKTLEVSTKMSTLRQYDEQKISKEKAADLIELKEVF